jgi:histidine triad (HIT) family protein
MAGDCLFCRIVAGEVPAKVVRRENGMVAFHDIAPKAPVHVLVIPERHVDSMAGVEGLTPEERADMLVFISAVAREHGLEPTGYRVTTNHGPDALQSVHHLHWHVMGGTRLSDSM